MVAIQIDIRHRTRFGIGRIVMVGDRGMTTADRIRQEPELARLHWIPALKDADIRRLSPPSRSNARLRPGGPVAYVVAEIASPDLPGERLTVCLYSRLQEERRRRREWLVQATGAGPAWRSA